MHDWDCWLENLFEEPDQDLCRLSFAEWLEDRGEPGAFWVRLAANVNAVPPCDDPGRAAVLLLRSKTGNRQSYYPLHDLRVFGGNVAVRLFTTLALRLRLRDWSHAPPSSMTPACQATLWRVTVVAELFAAGLVGESVRKSQREELRARLRPWEGGRWPFSEGQEVIREPILVSRAADLALGAWRRCNFALELLVSSVRRKPAHPDRREINLNDRTQDAERMRRVIWQYRVLSECIAVALGKNPQLRHRSPRFAQLAASCNHLEGAAYEHMVCSWRCRYCGHFTDDPGRRSGED